MNEPIIANHWTLMDDDSVFVIRDIRLVGVFHDRPEMPDALAKRIAEALWNGELE